MKHLLSRGGSCLLVLIVGVSGCCKRKTEETEPLLLPEPRAAEQQVLSAEVVNNPLPTPTFAPTAAATDEYQSNGFPQAMPSTHTPIPSVSEWSRAPEITTRKFPDGCHMKFVREWLKINCSQEGTLTPLRIAEIKGFGTQGKDYFKFEKEGKITDIVVRTKDGKNGSALFVTAGRTYRVGYNWPYRAPFPSTIFE